MDESEEKGPKRRSSDPTKPDIDRGISKKGRRTSVAATGHCGGGSAEKKKSFHHGKHRRSEHEKKKSQRKLPQYATRNIDPLNLMGLSKKQECASPKVDSPHIGDRGLNFDPGNIRPVDLTDPLKLNDLDDNVLAVKVNSHKKRKKRKRRRTYSENDKDMKVLLESMGHDGDTEASENETHSPKKLDLSQTKPLRNVELGDEEKTKSINEKEDHVMEFVVPSEEEDRTQTELDIISKNEGVKKDEKVIAACETKLGDESNGSIQAQKMKSNLKEVGQEGTVKKYNIKFREKDKKFQYGNYNRYYGYRNPNMSEDERVDYLKREWFHDKDCLDIGCNVGHLTLYIARHFGPKSLTGIDIDDTLVQSARRNIQHYTLLSSPQAPKQSDFPISFPICHGPLAATIPPDDDGKSFGFPYNVSFKTENFVDFDWNQVKIEPKYDFVMCLSVTKWIQLNWGDDGVKKLFKRIFMSLHPGGKLLLEPQPWKSYKKKKNLTPKIRSNYDNIALKPDKYIPFLLSDEIGFATSEKLGIPKHKAQGFQRPMYLLTKGGSQQNEICERTSKNKVSEKMEQT